MFTTTIYLLSLELRKDGYAMMSIAEGKEDDEQLKKWIGLCNNETESENFSLLKPHFNDISFSHVIRRGSNVQEDRVTALLLLFSTNHHHH